MTDDSVSTPNDGAQPQTPTPSVPDAPVLPDPPMDKVTVEPPPPDVNLVDTVQKGLTEDQLERR
jgi:hypothetical protein